MHLAKKKKKNTELIDTFFQADPNNRIIFHFSAAETKPNIVMYTPPAPLLLSHFSQLIVAGCCQARHGVSAALRSGAATLLDGGKYFAGAFLRRTSHWGSTAAHNYLLFGWRRSGRGYGG